MASPSTGFPISLTLCLSLEMILRHINIEPVYFVLFHSFIDKINNKLHGLSPPGGLVSPPGGFASLAFDQAVPKNSQCHLANQNAICILHRSDCAWLCCLLSQFIEKRRTVYIFCQNFFVLCHFRKTRHFSIFT